MDVICFGLSLPLTEHEAIKDCVNVYCEWMTSLHPVPRVSVPKPICDDPNNYVRKIISHFHNLFVPRPDEGTCQILLVLQINFVNMHEFCLKTIIICCN